MEVRGRERVVATGNLVAALFEHDTSRAKDPQAHVHAVIANVTQGPDGKWRALHNEKLWSLNTLLNSIAMASFRERVEALGYEVGDRSKHGNFDAAGFTRNALMAFSVRRQQILAKVAEMTTRSPAAFDAATLMTRPRKEPAGDRVALVEAWRAKATVERIDPKRGTVTLRLSGGRERTFRPTKLRARDGETPIQLYERKELELHEKDRIRWTANDHDRGLFNADQARVLAIGSRRVTVETSLGVRVALPRDDSMLQRLDLAYALNAHMAQGLTSDRGIAVMETRDAKLVNQQTFLVTVTRLRDALTLVVDRAGQLERQLTRNPGGKTSALETTGDIRDARLPGSARGDQAKSNRLPPEKALDPDQGRPKPYELGI